MLIAVLIVSCFALPTSTKADTASDQARINDLQAQIEALEKQAAQFRGSIAEQQAKAASLKKEISILQSQIGAIGAEIAATNAKINKTKIEIGGVQDDIGLTRETMSRKRDTIGRMVLFVEQRDQESLLVSLFKYTDLSDFLQQFHDLASVQSELISIVNDLKSMKAELEHDKTELESKQGDLEKLSLLAAQRKASLDGVKYQKDTVLKVTKGQEAIYQKQLTEIEKKEAAFFKELRELELKVISGGFFIVHIKAVNLPPRGTKLFQRPEDKTVVTQGYGMTSYARRGAYGGAPHNGIDFSGGFGTPIEAIGSGKIVANGLNDGWGNWIAIQHPSNLVSIYGHMSRFAPIKVGSDVAQGQVIGYEGATGHATGSHVHLSLYREFFTFIKESNGQLNFNYFEGSLNPLDYM